MSNDLKAVKAMVEKKFGPSYSDLAFQPSNTKDGANGIHFTYSDKGKQYHIKIVEKIKCDKNGWSEIELLKDIDSPNVIKLLEHGELDRDNYYLIFQHIDGETVEKFDSKHWTKEEAKKFLVDMVSALDALKVEKLVHRDIKSKNIIRESKSGNYTLLDLGIGYFINKPQKTNTPISKTSGAKYFSSPEQMWISSGQSKFDICWISDQFSLGVVAYYAFSGQHPFSGTARPEVNNYTELVTGDRAFLKHLVDIRPDLGQELCDVVMRMLDVNPSKRYQTLGNLRSAISGQPEDGESSTKLIIKMTSEGKDSFKDYINEMGVGHDFGVLISSADALSNAKHFEDSGIEVMFDPQTYKLQTNKSPAYVEEKLNLPSSKENDFLWDERRLSDLKDDILHGVIQVNRKLNTKRIILPYYIVDNPESYYLGLTKEIWKSAKKMVTDTIGEDIEVYGGIILPKSMVENQERTVIMDSLLSDYDLDGVYVIFENDDEKIRTTTTTKYLTGINEYTHFFKAVFGKVIVSMSDISTLCLLNGGDYVVSWAKSSRHFNLHPPVRQSKKGEPKPPRKMQYYAPGLFTLIEEKTTVGQIGTALGDNSILECKCKYCLQAKPLSPAYKEQKQIEEFHFYESVGGLQKTFSLKAKAKETQKAILTALNTYNDNCTLVRKKAGLTTEVIPDFEGLISVVKD